jgi:hypothetical protein
MSRKNLECKYFSHQSRINGAEVVARLSRISLPIMSDPTAIVQGCHHTHELAVQQQFHESWQLLQNNAHNLGP